MKGNRCGKEKLCLKQQFSLDNRIFLLNELMLLCSLFLQYGFHPFDVYLDPGPLYLLIGGSILYSVLRVLGCRRVLASTSKVSFLYFCGSFWPSKDIFSRIFLKDASGFVAGAVMRSPESVTLKCGTLPISFTPEVHGKLMRSLWEMGGSYFLGP